MKGKRNNAGLFRAEMREYLIVVADLYVCFGALLLFKAALLREEGLNYLPLGLAAGKSLILCKFVLIGESARVGSWFKAATLLRHIARKVLLFLLLLVALSVVEEFVVGLIRGHSFADTLADYEGRSMLEILATCLLLLLVLIPYVTVSEVRRALGPGVLRQLLLAQPERTPGAEERDT